MAHLSHDSENGRKMDDRMKSPSLMITGTEVRCYIIRCFEENKKEEMGSVGIEMDVLLKGRGRIGRRALSG